MVDSLSFDELRTIAENLATGFQALLEHVQEQKLIENRLRLRLERAVEKELVLTHNAKYEQLDRSCNSSSEEISGWREEIVKQIDHPLPDTEIFLPTIPDEKIDKAQQAIQRLSADRMPSTTPIRKCPVSHKTTDQEDFEHDFTTPGRIGDLGCPFAKMSNGHDAPCDPDPIADEFHVEKASGRSKSSGQAGSRCPIRFLDRHSPEEIAQYFENHKHEIPRSHQICVKRYQQNEDSIRQLDAKYGNMVSMIQGLGNKHKAYLPENEKVADEPERDSSKAVEKWAENISHNSVIIDEPDRLPHFERPLRDIRVGESPSRPWGISVPVNKTPAASASPSEDGGHLSEKAMSIAPAPAPIPTAAGTHNPHVEQPKQQERPAPIQPQIVFNGPVFFGYSAEQAALFLQTLNIGNPTK